MRHFFSSLALVLLLVGKVKSQTTSFICINCNQKLCPVASHTVCVTLPLAKVFSIFNNRGLYGRQLTTNSQPSSQPVAHQPLPITMLLKPESQWVKQISVGDADAEWERCSIKVSKYWDTYRGERMIERVGVEGGEGGRACKRYESWDEQEKFYRFCYKVGSFIECPFMASKTALNMNEL